MADLGVMTVELLRINFGERVPGFSQALARALYISVPELMQRVEAGELSNEDAIAALGSVACRADRIVMRYELLFASILLNRDYPLAPHHIGAIREMFDYKNDEELKEFVRTGK